MNDLFYPASFLPHKNHFLLNSPIVIDFLVTHGLKVYLTIDSSDISFSSSNIVLLGPIPHELCMRYLDQSFALLFLSSFESLGLPLVEASQLGKPVVCPNLAYSRELLGDSAYYFIDQSPHSLCHAISSLINSLDSPIISKLHKTIYSTDYAWNTFKQAFDYD